LLFGIRGLREGDRFNVINFAGEEHLMESKMISADSAGKKRGEEFVGKLAPNGGTNINDAIRAGLRQFDSSDRPKMLVFMTDGLPTVGESNVESIIRNSREIKVENLRLFAFGVGYDVNTQLLDKLAAENSGAAEYIEPKENLEIKVSNFFTKVNSPVLTDLEMDFGAVETDFLYPRKLTDVFKGTQLTLIGRYKNASHLENITLRLRGKSGRETRDFNYANLDFPLRSEQNEFLPRLWATRRVGWLVEQIRSNGENKELRDEIVQLGTRFGIVTPYTSYLATDGSGQIREEDRAVSRQITALPTVRRDARNASPGLMASSGQIAVEASKKARRQQNSVTISVDADETIRTDAEITIKKVGVKTFYLDNGIWIDSEFKTDLKLSETKLKFADSNYFDLIGKEPELGKFFALGEQVVVVWKGRVYRVFN
jgi:Ca-activated chloride channel family protein